MFYVRISRTIPVNAEWSRVQCTREMTSNKNLA